MPVLQKAEEGGMMPSGRLVAGSAQLWYFMQQPAPSASDPGLWGLSSSQEAGRPARGVKVTLSSDGRT